LYGRGTVLNPVISSPTYPVEYTRNLSHFQIDAGVEKTGYKDIPILDAAAVLNEEKKELTIFAVNKDQKDSLDFSCDLREFGAYRLVEHLVLQHNNLKATNTAENPDNVTPHSNGNATVIGDQVKASLAKLSWNVIRLSKK
jgi:alpha-N-arabinofuranosidase